MASENLENISFSLKEIQAANIASPKSQGIKVDWRRKSCHNSYVDLLKNMNKTGNMQVKSLKKAVKKPAVKKISPAKTDIKKETPVISDDKPKATKKITSKKISKKTTAKVKASEPVVSDSKVAKIEDLEGMAPRFISRLKDLGIDTPEKLVKEDVKELASLIKSTQKLVKSWKAQITGEE